MRAQLLVNLRVYREAFFMEQYVPSDPIFALVKEGSFCVESADGCFTVGPDEGALFRKGVLYNRRVLEPVTMYLFRFRTEAPVFLSDHITFANTARIRSTVAMLEQLDTGVYRDEFAHRCALFEDLLNQYAMENEGVADVPRAEDPRIRQAISRISETLHKKPDLAQIAQESGLSYVQFIRRFKQSTGMTPSDYVTALRLQKAKQLLGDTTLPIKEIAYACGFENEYYFSNFFKKHFTVSPSAFRKASI